MVIVGYVSDHVLFPLSPVDTMSGGPASSAYDTKLAETSLSLGVWASL